MTFGGCVRGPRLVVTCDEWSPPVNDGGQGISKFLVEWWSNYNNNYGTNEIQTILMNADVDGGTWLLTSPAGYQYPFPLPWDIEYDELEAVLESGNSWRCPHT